MNLKILHRLRGADITNIEGISKRVTIWREPEEDQ